MLVQTEKSLDVFQIWKLDSLVHGPIVVDLEEKGVSTDFGLVDGFDEESMFHSLWSRLTDFKLVLTLDFCTHHIRITRRGQSHLLVDGQIEAGSRAVTG